MVTEERISSPTEEKMVEEQSPALEAEKRTKLDEIKKACANKDVNALARHTATPFGLVSDELRRIAWPLLLNCSSIAESDSDWKSRPPHRDEAQVKLDVDRSFVYYSNTTTDEELDEKKDELSSLITKILRQHPMLCYFQGYHDIAQVFLLVLGKDYAASAMTYVSLFRMRDYMLPSLTPALVHLHLIPSIIASADSQLFSHISDTKPFFALSATLTWYAHDIQEYGEIARLYDFLIAHEPVVSIYLFAALIRSRREELLEIPPEEPEMLHFTLSKLPSPLNLDSHIQEALELFERHPPESLPFRAWKRVSPNSVLKTSRNLMSHQSLRDGEVYFAKQTQEMKRQELQHRAKIMLWKYRRPVGSIGVALLVGAFSFWLRRSGHERLVWHVLSVIRDSFVKDR